MEKINLSVLQSDDSKIVNGYAQELKEFNKSILKDRIFDLMGKIEIFGADILLFNTQRLFAYWISRASYHSSDAFNDAMNDLDMLSEMDFLAEDVSEELDQAEGTVSLIDASAIKDGLVGFKIELPEGNNIKEQHDAYFEELQKSRKQMTDTLEFVINRILESTDEQIKEEFDEAYSIGESELVEKMKELLEYSANNVYQLWV